MKKNSDLHSELILYSENFNVAYEGSAVHARRHFLNLFPLKNITNITLDEYVIGRGTVSFCACVEAKTKAWANMQGATANKFGIYFGKTNSDSTMKYRFTKKFGANQKEAFGNVKEALLNLVKDGELLNFERIDNNPLSQMFKAKILSLYFPNEYINICSADHIKSIALKQTGKENLYISEYQNFLINEKLNNGITKDWSNPKFMSFLYSKYIHKNLNPANKIIFKKTRAEVKHRVNFKDITESQHVIGEKSELFALEWEKNRLKGIGYDDLIDEIEDRRNIPSYGYDYLSHSQPGHERYIEVKSIGKDKKENYFRFFLSENEHTVSVSDEHRDDYYFYLVRYNKHGNPCNVSVKKAAEFYTNSEMIPCAYKVKFDINE